MAAFVAAAGLVTTAGVVTRGFYRADNAKPISAITSFSATDSAASRSAVRGAINSADKDTSFVTVKINGDSRVVLGEKGVMETTSLVKRAGGAVVSSNVFTSWVKKAPVDKVILVGTGSGSTAASDPQSGGLGTTVPAGEIQSWAHQYLLDNQRIQRGRLHRRELHHQPRVGMEPHRHQPLVRRLRSGAGLSGQQDGVRRRGLADQLQDPVQMVHQLLRTALCGTVAAYNYWVAHKNY